MKECDLPYQELLGRVAAQLAKTPATTDHLMLTRWRVLSVCQYLLGGRPPEIEGACAVALDAFALHGAGAAADKALQLAGAAIRRAEGGAPSVLPSISNQKRIAVAQHLESLSGSDSATIEQALRILPGARKRLSAALSFPGIRHRLEIVASVMSDTSRSEEERARAAAAVLYVHEVEDVIPDSLGLMGMLDDDYALRIVLSELGKDGDGEFHWSEKIASLWDDLPFLQGVNLQRGDSPIAVSWLDRVNSYVSYSHVLGLEKAPLLLLQPSIACSPLHAIVSLVGLLVLDAVTSSQTSTQALRAGQTYEVDGFFVRFEGLAGPPTPGWLRLRMRDSSAGAVYVHEPPALADRMIPVDDRRLSPLRDFSSRPREASAEPIQRFFDWDAAIGTASISSRLIIVSSRQRALELLERVQSNGVRLLEHGLVRFVGTLPTDVETHGTMILVVPSLNTVRVLLDRGIAVQAILVEGYERLYRGRHDLPFLMNRESAPPIIGWSATGYYPAAPPTWLPPHKRLEVSSDDLVSILELDEASTADANSPLWEAATGVGFQPRLTAMPASERAVIDSIDDYLAVLRSCQGLPEYWQYHLTTLARTFRILVTSTPAEWSEIKGFAANWSASVEEKWSSLRPAAVQTLSGVRDAERRILTTVGSVPDVINSRGGALRAFLSETTSSRERWYFPCDRAEQMRAVDSLIRTLELRNVEPVLLRDLAVCRHCVVAGWINTSFTRRLWAHTPRGVVALVDEDDRKAWQRAVEAHHHPVGDSLLGAVGAGLPGVGRIPASSVTTVGTVDQDEEAGADWSLGERTQCVFLWVTGEDEAKVLACDARIVLEDGEVVRERAAASLRPDDRVILGLGTRRWSPADEFTEALVEAVRRSRPALVNAAKEWRRALLRLQEAQHKSLWRLRAELAVAGVVRTEDTIEGWLNVERASPIAPRSLRGELAALWPLISNYAEQPLDEIVSACSRLRSLRTAASHGLLQLWKGRAIDLGVDESLLEELVVRLRQEVHVYEVEAITMGEVASAMLGWWISAAVAATFELESRTHSSNGPDGEGEDDPGDAGS